MQTDSREVCVEVCVEVCARCLCLRVGVCCEVPWRCGEVWQGVAGVWQGCGEAVTTALPAAYLGKGLERARKGLGAAACSESIASTAWLMRRRPSNRKGLVTMPTVRQPHCFASSAITGAAPEPVPPPIPAVTNTCAQHDTATSRPAASRPAPPLARPRRSPPAARRVSRGLLGSG